MSDDTPKTPKKLGRKLVNESLDGLTRFRPKSSHGESNGGDKPTGQSDSAGDGKE